MSSDLSRVACVIPAKDEEQRIAATVTAARDLPGVEIVIVCDDGSSDRTSQNGRLVRGRSSSPIAATVARPLRWSLQSTVSV